MRSSSWLVSRPMRCDPDIGSPSQMLTSIEDRVGDRGNSRILACKPRVARVLCHSEADRGGSGGKGEGGRVMSTERPGDGRCWGRMEEEDG
jgi:hypothetical protein